MPSRLPMAFGIPEREESLEAGGSESGWGPRFCSWEIIRTTGSILLRSFNVVENNEFEMPRMTPTSRIARRSQ